MTDKYLIHTQVDARGTRCPIPLLRAKQALKTMVVGDYLQLEATDPSAKGDFEAMLKHLPHELVHYTEGQTSPRVDTFIIRKG